MKKQVNFRCTGSILLGFIKAFFLNKKDYFSKTIFRIIDTLSEYKRKI
jgi:hypothetical protein